MDFPSHTSLQLGEGALCTGARGCLPCYPCPSPQGSPTKLGSPEGVGQGTCSPALSLSPFSFLEVPLAWRAPCGLPLGLTLNHLGPGHTRGPEVAGPSGLCAEPRPGHLGWPEAEAVAPSAPRPSLPARRVERGRGPARGQAPKGRDKILSRKCSVSRGPFRTPDKLSSQKGRGSRPPLILLVIPRIRADLTKILLKLFLLTLPARLRGWGRGKGGERREGRKRGRGEGGKGRERRKGPGRNGRGRGRGRKEGKQNAGVGASPL